MTKYTITSTGGTGVDAPVYKDVDGTEYIVFGVGLDRNVEKQADHYGFGDDIEGFKNIVKDMAVSVANTSGLELTDKTVFLEENFEVSIDKEVDIPEPSLMQIVTGRTSHLLHKVS